jgi:hypothetical protein
MVLRKTVCQRRLGGNRAGELRAGRFFASPKVTTDKIVESWSQQTTAAVAGRHVLAIDDTCEVRFPTSALCRRGLGQIGHGNIYGALVHAMIAVDADSGGVSWAGRRAGVDPAGRGRHAARRAPAGGT